MTCKLEMSHKVRWLEAFEVSEVEEFPILGSAWRDSDWLKQWL